MLFPKKVKYRKWRTARSNPKKKSVATRGTTVAFGSYGLKAVTGARITANQIEASRRVITRALGKTGRVWIRMFPDRPVTQKGAETPMGSGKGDPVHFVFEAKPGRVLFEVDGVSEAVAREALRRGGAKLPLKTFTIAR